MQRVGPPGDEETKYCIRLNNKPQLPRGKGQGGSALSVRLGADDEEENVRSGVEMMVSSESRNTEIEGEGVRVWK